MSPAEAKKILEMLAIGLDPGTGEPFTSVEAFNSAQVIRALFIGANALSTSQALEQVQQADKAARKDRNGPAMAGKPWDSDEDGRLVAAFDSGTAIAESVTIHKRTQGAIRSRLMRLGKISA